MIYVPKGRALEYSPLACNIAVGCPHRCAYCYGPSAFRMNPKDWPTPRYKENAVSRFEASAKKFAGDPREILFCFATDPYMTEEAANIMDGILPLAEKHDLRVQILTKNPLRAMHRHRGIIAKNGWKLGTTICFMSEILREKWEPGAPSISSRLEALALAKKEGISTWVSIEPVVDPDEAIAVIKHVKPMADFIKIGKWNHSTEAAKIDWTDFLRRAREALGDHPHLVKEDLLKYGKEGE
jgi:DNA repair photolyase